MSKRQPFQPSQPPRGSYAAAAAAERAERAAEARRAEVRDFNARCGGATIWTIDPVLRRLGRALELLGDTPERVAHTLAALGCRGERHNPCYCPVVVYLRRQRVGKFALALVGRRLHVTGRDAWEEQLVLPAAVRDFAAAFDEGDHPALDMNRPAVAAADLAAALAPAG